MIDLRRVLTRADTLDALAEAIWSRLEPALPFQIGGMETAAIPLVSAILMKSFQKGRPLNGFIIRKERKTHGAGALIEGELTDEPVVLVDDILNSGHSAEKAVVVLAEQGRSIARMVVVIDYQSAAGGAWSERRGIGVESLFTLGDFGLSISEPVRRPRPEMFETVWTFKSPDPNFHDLVPKSFPAVDVEHVYFGSDSGLFRALDAATGALVWDFRVRTRQHKNIWSSPELHGGRVYFGGFDGNVYCLDARTGAEIWRNTGAEWVGSSPAIAPDLNRLFIGLEFAV